MSILSRTLAITAMAVMLGGRALAQVADLAVAGPDSGQNAAQPTTPQPSASDPAQPPKQFRIMLTAPLLATSNAAGPAAADIASPSGKPDVHLNPDLLVRWMRQFEFVKLSAGVDVSIDRFAINTDQNTDSLYGAFKAALTDGRSDLFVPYVIVAPTVDYGPFFSVREDALLDFALGFSSGFGISSRGNLVPLRDAIEPGDGQVVFDMSAGRRLADPPDFRNVFLIAKVDLAYNVNRNLLIGITPGVRLRHYDSYYGFPRRDVRLGWIARAEWTPDWLTRRIPAAEIDFTIAFLRNSSNLPSANYTVWEGGPALVLTWRF